MMGGTIRVTSVEGQGSQFIVRLPAVYQRPPLDASDTSNLPTGTA
jgi:hypothetical protein